MVNNKGSLQGDQVGELNNFKLKKYIGAGGFGKVFLVQKDVTKEVFAMKVIKKDEVINAEMLEATLLEKRILSQTDHQFMVGTKYVFQDEYRIYFIMNFVRGGNLF